VAAMAVPSDVVPGDSWRQIGPPFKCAADRPQAQGLVAERPKKPRLFGTSNIGGIADVERAGLRYSILHARRLDDRAPARVFAREKSAETPLGERGTAKSVRGRPLSG